MRLLTYGIHRQLANGIGNSRQTIANRAGRAITNTTHVSRNQAAASAVRSRGPAPRDEETCQERDELRQARGDQSGPGSTRPSSRASRAAAAWLEVDAFAIPLDDHGHRDVDLVVRAERAPGVAVDDGDTVDGDQVVADSHARPKGRCCWAYRGNDDSTCRRRIRLEPRILWTKQVAVDEQREVDAERPRHDEDPEGGRAGPAAGSCRADTPHCSQAHLGFEITGTDDREEPGL